MLTEEDIHEFREAYKKDYGEGMPVEDARMWAIRLVRLYEIIIRPTPSEIAARLAKSRTQANVGEPPVAACVERRESPPDTT